MVDMIKGLCIVYENNSDCLPLVQSAMPFVQYIDQCMARGTTLDGSELFLVKLFANCIEYPLAGMQAESSATFDKTYRSLL
jgi:hypothetical protein